MGKLLLCYDNTIDECTLSGGAWTATLPLPYLQTRQLDQRARTAGTDTRNTWHYISAPSAITMAAFAALGGNFSTSAQLRLRAWTSSPIAAIDLVCTGDSPPSGITTARTDTAYYINRQGVLASAGSGVARVGWDLDTGLPLGLIYEPSATNLALRSRDGSNATWTKSSATAALTSTGLDGVANAATTLTATSSNGQMTQSITAASAARRLSMYVRRVVGSGTVTISGDNFATSTAIVPPSTKYKRFDIAVSGTNPVIGIRLATSGDAVAVDFVQLEGGSVPTTPIPTTTATVTRQQDSPRYLNAESAGLSFATGTVVVKAKLMSIPASVTGICTLYGAAADQAGISHDGTRIFFSVVRLSEQVGANGPTLVAGDVGTFAMAWATNNVRYSSNGSAAAQDTTAAVPTGSSFHLNLGSRDGSVNHVGYIERVRVYAAAMTNAQLQGLSGSELETPADFDSGTFDAWPAAYVAATTERMRRGEQTPALYRPGAAQSYPYWRVDINDTSNADGWIEYGRPMMAWNAFQSERDVACGLGIYFKPRSTTVTTASGARYFDELPAPKCLDFTFHYLADAEAWDTIYELMRTQGATGEVLVSLDPDDARNLPRHTFLATVADMEKLRAMAKGYWTKAFTAEQLL